jgi:phage terminase small subunit
MELTAKQLRFIDEYMVDRNGAAAAVRAGYSARCAKEAAYELLTKAHILAVLREKEAAEAERLQLSRENALEGFLEAIAIAKTKPDPAAMISGWREIGKMLGFYAPILRSVKLSTENHALRTTYEALSDEELLAIASSAS